MNITNIVNKHLDSVISDNGILLKFSGSYEDDNSQHDLKFFSRHTHTIYAPKLEVRWDDHKPVLGSNTGSMLPLSMSGEVNNHIFINVI